MAAPIGGPADFIRDPKTGDLFVPAMIDGEFLRVPLAGGEVEEQRGRIATPFCYEAG